MTKQLNHSKTVQRRARRCKEQQGPVVDQLIDEEQDDETEK